MDLRTVPVVFILTVVVACCLAENANVTVQTQVGTFIGFKTNVSVEGATVELAEFLGIPFAEPPVGNLRFRKPMKKARLQEPMVVQKHGAECIQIEYFPGNSKSEDCLYLNIYAPVKNDGRKLAVMVWIYGGGFLFGSADTYVSDVLAATGDVIVVTFNYRLFVLGFLNIQGTDTSANSGLWDQQLAIKWVHDNIEQFGGDKDRITIFGESAGAASAIYQGLYPGNKGLFHRIIAGSGTASVSWAHTKSPMSEAMTFGSQVGCIADSSQKLVDCLRALPVENITYAINNFALTGFPTPFVPSVDYEFVITSPYDIFRRELNVASGSRSAFAMYDVLLGVNGADGGGLLGELIGVKGDINRFLPNRTFFERKLVPTCIKITFGEEADKISTNLVAAEYREWNDPDNSVAIRDHFVNMYSDALYFAPMLHTLNFHSEVSNKNSYMYLFTSAPTSHLFPGAPSWLDNKAVHGDEMLYIFGETAKFEGFGHQGPFQDWEKELSKHMMKLWANFAKTGNMNQPYDIGVDWQPYSKAQPSYLEITSNITKWTVKERLREREANLWNNILPSIIQSMSGADCDRNTTSSASILGTPYRILHNINILLLLICLVF